MISVEGLEGGWMESITSVNERRKIESTFSALGDCPSIVRGDRLRLFAGIFAGFS